MPASGPVYQPTTVSYEGGGSNWAGMNWGRAGSLWVGGPRALQWLLLVIVIISTAAGLVLIIDGALALSAMGPSDGSGRVPLAVGILLLVASVAFAAFFIKLTRRRRACPCFPNKEERLARQLDSQGANGQVLTANPSTDLLVTAQYAPVSEIAYQPPAAAHSDHEETSKLMPSDLIKDCNEESERMLESDPRIVLRPLSHGEEA